MVDLRGRDFGSGIELIKAFDTPYALLTKGPCYSYQLVMSGYNAGSTLGDPSWSLGPNWAPYGQVWVRNVETDWDYTARNAGTFDYTECTTDPQEWYIGDVTEHYKLDWELREFLAPYTLIASSTFEFTAVRKNYVAIIRRPIRYVNMPSGVKGSWIYPQFASELLSYSESGSAGYGDYAHYYHYGQQIPYATQFPVGCSEAVITSPDFVTGNHARVDSGFTASGMSSPWVKPCESWTLNRAVGSRTGMDQWVANLI